MSIVLIVMAVLAIWFFFLAMFGIAMHRSETPGDPQPFDPDKFNGMKAYR